MSETATFDENDWRDLTPADKKALKVIPRYSAGDFEIIAKMVGLGQPSMDALLAKGLAVEGEPSKVHGRRFRLTEKGWLAFEWINGRRTRVFPQPSK
jgi:hypothetical protein